MKNNKVMRIGKQGMHKKVKVKFALEQAMNAQRASIGIALLFLYPQR
jgi:hypothetical protein